MISPTQFQLTATCPKGLEQLLAEELSQLGASDIKQTVAAVNFTGTMETAYRACLWSRLANRVLLKLAELPVKSKEELYQQLQTIDWADHIDVDSDFLIDFTGASEAIRNTRFGALTVKDAIVDQFRNKFGRRPNVAKEQPGVRVSVRLKYDQVTVAIDLAGISLHERGYRREAGMAPLKENLAAAMLVRAGWPSLKAQSGSLVDPMCGAGTLLIEAGLMAADIAPGLLRNYFGFQGWLGHIPAIWNKLVAEAKQRREQGMSQQFPVICGFEPGYKVLTKAQANIERAGLAGVVKIKQVDLAQLTPSAIEHMPTGLMITNPPYGERLGNEASLVYLYQHLGEKMRQCFSGWQAAFLTSSADLARRTQLRSHKHYKLYNGALECALYLFAIPEENFATDASIKRASVDKSVQQATTHIRLSKGAEMFANRLRKNLKQLKKWRNQHNIHCYRLYDADMPEYAVAIDCYNEWVHVQEYAPPKSIDPEKAAARLNDIISALPVVLDVPEKQVIVKRREQQQGKKQYQKRDSRGEFMQVEEHGCQLLVNLQDYLDTGLFLDHRPIRHIIQQQAKGKRFLNLFCYTASASVHAAKGGAVKTTSVDLSKNYLNWADKNFRLNGFSQQRHQLVEADSLAWLKEQTQRYDLIFIDPPTFSNSKKLNQDFDVQRDHGELIMQAMRLLTREGVLYFSNNFRKFKIDESLLDKFKVKEITPITIDPDFQRNAKIHRCWEIRY
ncbi:bifunctional 23S rRNA (guanine(2069)-N(7))-methyltransferase RlmK/23S rRNA (guanine(2445)-N(2))-methyltransferase RlmL [Endozoicomonas sp. SM1973]|uniref:Ribosomal RNA large subunit methyltransferase K/L n=1 Tax=Spartinivicinus marinus TaxID=2994442 RepID=A0A853I875_9GAMM|nr:bifunctional 23S rRNA (guanine(2069)-N(7))-methyltransferase RlmK/23S rRNA (guanine(2445)-N(2))-methyltransferase RlmL [Spartinivicinus marinus]MCX4028982.1 bifunctional 23S rRNA (guanine(2069)-N(7))-methyltransferase RlmK/23S rRNA (guanine(2445)-N(2))-methyltransferase RlmL [Spartinivicinus marinus]NYZ65435.1 bifunctional 23S rRNA (guanine(2069)-N(7))-methyltransferase RlmK/23S rRNA (guanine(2445)-N(2))-methyltransferase RlmL [Spartinivicinus marinus]